MRHLWSFLLSLVLTPLIYVSAGFSAVKFADAKELGLSAVLGLVSAFVAGGLYALLVMARLSPVGPVFAGLSYLGVTLWAMLDRASFADVVPADLAGEEGLLHVPVGFGTALLAAPLLVTVFSPRRWRSSADPAATTYEAAAAPVYPPTPATAAPSYTDTDTVTSAAPTYEPPVYTPPTYTPSLATPAPSPADPPEGERTGLT